MRRASTPRFLPAFPELAADTYATVGLEGPASTSGQAGAADPSIVEDVDQMITPFFLTDGATLMESNTLTGASWYVLNTASNGLADDDNRVLIMQVTTAGDISGQINYQVFPLGVGENQAFSASHLTAQERLEETTTSAACGCTDASASTYDERRTTTTALASLRCGEGCTDAEACNYDAKMRPTTTALASTPRVWWSKAARTATACNYDAERPTTTARVNTPRAWWSKDAPTSQHATTWIADATDDDGSCVFPDRSTTATTIASTTKMPTECEVHLMWNPVVRMTRRAITTPKPQTTTARASTPRVWTLKAARMTLACNYNPEATEDDGSCDFCSCQRPCDAIHAWWWRESQQWFQA